MRCRCGTGLRKARPHALGQQRLENACAIGKAVRLDSEGLQLRQPEISERKPLPRVHVIAIDPGDGPGGLGEVNVGAGLQAPASTACNDDGQCAVLVGSTIPQTGSVGEDRIIQKRAAVCLLDRIHLSQ